MFLYLPSIYKLLTMRTKPIHTIVVIPGGIKLEVSYYTSDLKMKDEDKKDFTDLIIQLHDCHSSVKIPRAKISDPHQVEAIVQKTVINARGHLCD